MPMEIRRQLAIAVIVLFLVPIIIQKVGGNPAAATLVATFLFVAMIVLTWPWLRVGDWGGLLWGRADVLRPRFSQDSQDHYVHWRGDFNSIHVGVHNISETVMVQNVRYVVVEVEEIARDGMRVGLPGRVLHELQSDQGNSSINPGDELLFHLLDEYPPGENRPITYLGKWGDYLWHPPDVSDASFLRIVCRVTAANARSRRFVIRVERGSARTPGGYPIMPRINLLLDPSLDA